MMQRTTHNVAIQVQCLSCTTPWYTEHLIQSSLLTTYDSASVPYSLAVVCGVLQDPVNGIVDLNGGVLYRSIAVYACNAGYTLNGNLTQMCLEDGTWNRQEPTCEREPHTPHHPACAAAPTEKRCTAYADSLA